jgi:protocatechuate 3,4-dioxygenase alpha subunit
MTTETKPDGITPSQTVGPFFHYMLTPKSYGFPELFTNQVATPDTVGKRIRVEGYIIDGDGEPIIDALVELWQPDGEGRFASGAGQAGSNTSFTGFGRCEVDSNGFFSFDTVLPGQVPGPNGALQAPHIDVAILARGVLRRLFTRLYFEGEAANDEDAILALVPEERRSTLIAKRSERGGQTVYTFNIRLQGGDETVFFTA